MSEVSSLIRFDAPEGEYVSLESLLDWLREHPMVFKRKDGSPARTRVVPLCVWGAKGIGKCLSSQSSVVVNGTLLRAEEVWDRFSSLTDFDGEGYWSEPWKPLHVASLNEDGALVQGRVTRLYRQRVAEWGRRVRLDDGSEVTMTARHRLLGVDDWQREIAVGDRVCVPRTLPWNGPRVNPDLTLMLAWQIAEGDECQPGVLRITQGESGTLRRVREAAMRFGQQHEVQMNSMPIRAPILYISSRSYQRHLEGLGYRWGCKSAQKRIPDFIVSADDATVALFLGEFLAAEGHVNEKCGQVEITSASRELMQQLSVMLRRFGVWMRISAKRACATNGSGIERTYWRGLVMGASLRRLAEHVTIPYDYKQQALLRCAQRPQNSNVEGVPIGDLLIDARELTGLPRDHLGADYAYFRENAGGSAEVAQGVLTALRAVGDGSSEAEFRSRPFNNRSYRGTLAAYDNLDSVSLEGIADRLVSRISREAYYAKVVEVEPVWLDGWVYDLEVAEHHNYVAGGMITHNTAQMQTYCDERELLLKTYHPSHDESGADIVGEKYLDSETGRTKYGLPFWLPTDDDPPGLLFMDEINRAPLSVLRGLMEPLGEGTVSQSGWRLPEHWQIAAAANPGEAGYDVEIMDDAMVDRLLHYAPGWDAPTWAAWAQESEVVPREVIDFALTHRQLIETGEAQLPLEVVDRLQATPRSLTYFGALYRPDMSAGMLRVVSHGLLGRDAAPVFIADQQDSEHERPLLYEQLLKPGYAPKLTQWIKDRKLELITATTLRMVAGLVGQKPDHIIAGKLGQYLALIPNHLRPEAMAEIYRSAPDWSHMLRAATDHYLQQLARRG